MKRFGQRGPRSALRGARHRPAPHLAGQDRPSGSSLDPGLTEPRQGAAPGALGTLQRCSPARTGWSRSSTTSHGHGNPRPLQSATATPCSYPAASIKLASSTRSSPRPASGASAPSSPPTSPPGRPERRGERGGLTERLRQYDIYREMLAAWFNVPPRPPEQGRGVREAASSRSSSRARPDEAP